MVTRSVNDERCHVVLVTVTGPRMSHIRFLGNAGELVGLWIHLSTTVQRNEGATGVAGVSLSESCEKETFADDVPTTSFLIAKVGVILRSTINVLMHTFQFHHN